MKSIFFLLALLIPLLNSAYCQSRFAGQWSGKLNLGTAQLTLQINISGDKDSLRATIDSPDQGAMGLEVRSVTVRADSIFLDIKSVGAYYAAALVSEGDSVYLQGKFRQGNFSLDLKCKKSTGIIKLNRPQEPQPPFPYLSEEVAFENKEAGIKFSGTFTRPKGNGKFPAVVLVTGSGPQDRDANIFGHKPFAVLADHLARNGVAALRYDERGVGKSTGDYAAATTYDFTLDALAAVHYLKSRNDVEKNKTGIIGHSEGGIVAPMAASISSDVNFIVMMAGVGIPGDELLIMQTRDVLKSESAPENLIEKQILFSRELYDIIKTKTDSVSFYEAANDLISEFISILSDEEKEIPYFSKESLSAMLKVAHTKWFRYFLSLNPGEYLVKVTVPVLAINGTKDIQVPYAENLAAIEKSFKLAKNKNYKIAELEGLNHLFQRCSQCKISEYGKIEETINPEALNTISNWLKIVTK